MGDEKIVLVLDRYDHNTLLNTLNEKRNNLIKQNKPTDAIDDVFLKVIDAPSKKFFKKKGKVKDEAR